MKVKIDDDFETILICAERYALGRETYMPKLVMDYIRPLLGELSDRMLSVLERDIMSADYYGSETIDKPEWMKFLSEVKSEKEQRITN